MKFKLKEKGTHKIKSTKEKTKEKTSKNTAKFNFLYLSQIQGKTQERQLVSAYQK